MQSRAGKARFFIHPRVIFTQAGVTFTMQARAGRSRVQARAGRARVTFTQGGSIYLEDGVTFTQDEGAGVTFVQAWSSDHRLAVILG